MISGASGGLGAALALECARRGARLALCSRDLKATALVAAKATSLGSPLVKAYALDVGSSKSVKAAVAKASRDLGGLDVLINNAGIHFFSDVEAMPEESLAKVLDTNLFGPIRLIKELMPLMRRQRGGLIVNIGSTLGLRSIPGGGGYAASKAALARVSESLRVEAMPYGVRVLHVSPGVVVTRLRQRALYQGKPPASSTTLPFPRSAEKTAMEIADAMESGKRELLSAAFPVKVFMLLVARLAPGWVDKRMLKS